MVITATEFKTNLGKYLELVNDEDILIMKNGKIVAQLTQPTATKLALLNSLVGIAEYDNYSEDDDDLDVFRAERLRRQ